MVMMTHTTTWAKKTKKKRKKLKELSLLPKKKKKKKRFQKLGRRGQHHGEAREVIVCFSKIKIAGQT